MNTRLVIAAARIAAICLVSGAAIPMGGVILCRDGLRRLANRRPAAEAS